MIIFCMLYFAQSKSLWFVKVRDCKSVFDRESRTANIATIIMDFVIQSLIGRHFLFREVYDQSDLPRL